MSLLALAVPCQAEKVEVGLTDAAVVTKPGNTDVERGFLAVPLPAVLDSVFLDVAELVLTVSVDRDQSDPFMIAAFASTSADRPTSWSEDWTASTGDFTSVGGGLVSLKNSSAGTEVSIDVTGMVRRWLAGDATNNGVVLKSAVEGSSTFSWIRDDRYNGGDAKLVIHYSRLGP